MGPPSVLVLSIAESHDGRPRLAGRGADVSCAPRRGAVERRGGVGRNVGGHVLWVMPGASPAHGSRAGCGRECEARAPSMPGMHLIASTPIAKPPSPAPGRRSLPVDANLTIDDVSRARRRHPTTRCPA